MSVIHIQELISSGEVRRSKKKALWKQKKKMPVACRDGHRFCVFYKPDGCIVIMWDMHLHTQESLSNLLVLLTRRNVDFLV